jgi:hypothetical protein
MRVRELIFEDTSLADYLPVSFDWSRSQKVNELGFEFQR